jgi:hypothetical protein
MVPASAKPMLAVSSSSQEKKSNPYSVVGAVNRAFEIRSALAITDPSFSKSKV